MRAGTNIRAARIAARRWLSRGARGILTHAARMECRQRHGKHGRQRVAHQPALMSLENGHSNHEIGRIAPCARTASRRCRRVRYRRRLSRVQPRRPRETARRHHHVPPPGARRQTRGGPCAAPVDCRTTTLSRTALYRAEAGTADGGPRAAHGACAARVIRRTATVRSGRAQPARRRLARAAHSRRRRHPGGGAGDALVARGHERRRVRWPGRRNGWSSTRSALHKSRCASS